MKSHDESVCMGLLQDAAKREEILRHERTQALNELRDVREQRDQAWKETTELRREVEDLRARLARPLIPEPGA